MTKKNIKEESINPLISAFEICLIMKFNQNTKEYVFHKYREEFHTEEDWKGLFKKDGLNF